MPREHCRQHNRGGYHWQDQEGQELQIKVRSRPDVHWESPRSRKIVIRGSGTQVRV